MLNPFEDRRKMKARKEHENIVASWRMAMEGLNALPFGMAVSIMSRHIEDRQDVTHPALMVLANEFAQRADQIERDIRQRNEAEQSLRAK